MSVTAQPQGGGQPRIPWEERPAGCADVLWRYSGNPIVRRDAIATSNSIFNGAVVPFGGGFIGIFRCDDRTRHPRIHRGTSRDGIRWDIDPQPLHIRCDIPEIASEQFRYDPRLTFLDGRYYLTWCNGYSGPTIGIAHTEDFQTFTQMENAFLPCNRNGVLFPKKINGRYAMLSRPSDKGHTNFGDIFYSESPDLSFWGRHRLVMAPTPEWSWQHVKVGAGPVPIETREGWLLIYHGVISSCGGFTYSMGAALLDLDRPWIVRARTKPYIMSPQAPYECAGDVPNVVFPCAALHDPATGRLAVYYGAADTVMALAFGQIDELLDFTRTHSSI